jgi:tellurite resistance protein
MNIPPTIQAAAKALYTRFKASDYNIQPLVELGAMVAHADGTVDEKEIAALHAIYQALFNEKMDAKRVRLAIDQSLRLTQNVDLEKRARFIAEILVDCNAVEEGLMVALTVAFASDGLSDAERKVVARVARIADFADSDLDALITRVRELIEANPTE